MSTTHVRTPSYRRHKPTGKAVVTIDGRDVYLGKYGTPESKEAFDRIIAEWLTSGRRLPQARFADGPDVTINELLLAYITFADGYYRKGGRPTTEPTNIRLALRPVKQLYGSAQVSEFGPLALKTVRQSMINSGLCRTEVNKRIRKVVRAFKWGVGEELVSPTVHQGLRAVDGLRRGRTEVRESEPVKPVNDADVVAVRPFVARQVWALIELQRLTGMRPGEALMMRTCDIDTTSPTVWRYRPMDHKTAHHGKQRVIFLGPQAQEIVRPWLRSEPAEFLFQPIEAMEEHRAGLRENRKSKVTPSQAARKRKRMPAKSPGVKYTTDSYRRAITYGCKRAGVPPWHPHQLRHNAATRLRKEFGLDTARVVLGHSSAEVTEIYAEIDMDKALTAMEKVG